MSVNEEVLIEEIKRDTKNQNSPEKVRFRGKDVKIKNLKKKVEHKPNLIGTIVINLSIILLIIITILIFTGM